MITNENDILKYKDYNKIYIPSDFLNQNWQYRLNGDYVTVITNSNCYTQYSSTYCDCYLYNFKENLISNAYTCNTNNSNASIPYNSLTNDINYSEHIRNIFIQDKSILLLIIILGILFAKFLLSERNY